MQYTTGRYYTFGLFPWLFTAHMISRKSCCEGMLLGFLGTKVSLLSCQEVDASGSEVRHSNKF